MYDITEKTQREPTVPLPDGFAERMTRLQRGLLQDLQKEMRWRRRYREYYDKELREVLEHLDAARKHSPIDGFLVILNRDPNALDELLAEANSWGLAQADSDEQPPGPTAPVVASGLTVKEKSLVEEGKRRKEVRPREPKGTSTKVTKRKAVEEDAAGESNDKRVEESRKKLGNEEHRVAGKERSIKRRKLEADEGEARVLEAGTPVIFANAELEDFDAVQDDHVLPKRVTRLSRRSFISPPEVTSDIERSSVGTAIHVQRSSRTWPEWHGFGGEASKNLENPTDEGTAEEDMDKIGEGREDDGWGSSFGSTGDDNTGEVEGRETPIKAGKKAPRTAKAQTGKAFKGYPKKITNQSGIFSWATTSKPPKPSKPTADDAEVHLKSVRQATEYAKYNPSKVRLMEGEGRCLKCIEGKLNCWKATEGRRKTCFICSFAHKQCLTASEGAAESRPVPAQVVDGTKLRSPDIETDVGRAELLGLETIMAAAFGLSNMNLDEHKLTIAVREGEEVEVPYSDMMATLAPGVPILVQQIVHMREEQEQLKQKVDRLESLVDSQSVLLQKEMRRNSRRAKELRRQHGETQAKLHSIEHMLQELVSQRTIDPMLSATTPPAPPLPSSSSAAQTSNFFDQAPAMGPARSPCHMPSSSLLERSDVPEDSAGSPGALVIPPPTAQAPASSGLPVQPIEEPPPPKTIPVASPASSSKSLPSISALPPVAHHLLHNKNQLSASTLLPCISSISTAPQANENRDTSPDDNMPLAKLRLPAPTKKKVVPPREKSLPTRTTRSHR